MDKEKSLLEITPEGATKVFGKLINDEGARLERFLRFDPEKENISEASLTGFDLGRVLNQPGVEVDAQIMEVASTGQYILRRYNKESLYKRLETAPIIEATPQRRVTLSEAFVIAKNAHSLKENISYDGAKSNSLDPFNSFTPLFMGPFYRQQYMYKMLEAKSKAFKAFTTNPIAHRIPIMLTQFTLGKGVTAEFKNPKAKEWWDKFAKYNKIGTSGSGITRAGSRLRTWSNMLSVDGEAMFHFVDEGEMLRVKSLDTATILEVVSDPTDLEKVFYYHQQFATPYNMYSSAGVPGTRYVIRQLPAQDVLHVKLNVFANEKRGRSDLYTVLGWLKRYKDLVNANVIKAYFHACYTWDYRITGSPTDVKRFANNNKNKTPIPGSSYVHNEGVERTMISPTGSAGAGADNDAMGLLNLIALGTGISPTYLMGSFANSRAATLAETEPTSKMFFERQSIWDEILHEFAERLFTWLREKKGIDVGDTDVEFSFPQINPMDKTALSNLLIANKTQKWFSDKRCATMMSKELAVTSYDYEDEQREILAESKEAIDRELEENKHRSVAQTKLQVWQAIFAKKGAEEEHASIGGQTGGDPNAPAQGEQGAPGQTAGGQDGTNSGGMSDADTASLAQGGN